MDTEFLTIEATGDVVASAERMALGPRCIATAAGDLVCTLMRSSALGVNDFEPCCCRSADGGRTWSAPETLYPALAGRESLFLSISRDQAGATYLFGSTTPIGDTGESFWCETTQGLKQNRLVWARGDADGREWSEPQPIDVPFAGSAEAPGPLLVTHDGRWLGPFSPYNTFDPNTVVDRQCMHAVVSENAGASWSLSTPLRFEDPDSGAAEGWIAELADGRLVAGAWHTDLSGQEVSYPNAYAISPDSGRSWMPTYSMVTHGHTIALMPLADGRLAFPYVQRAADAQIGLWIAVADVNPREFEIDEHQCVWAAPVQPEAATSHDEWTASSFGEPALALLPDGAWLLVFWYADGDHSRVRWLRLRPQL
jgi:hypothetical protein